MVNPYKVLGVEDGASLEECKRAYRRLSKIHHPDRGGSEEVFKAITEAWGLISSGKAIVPKKTPVKSNPIFRANSVKSKYYHKSLFNIVGA